MREVSTAAVCAHLDVFGRHVPITPALFEGLPWDEAEVRSRSGRVDWDDYAVLLERLGEAAGSDAAIERVGETMDETGPWLTLLLQAMVSPRQVFRFWERTIGTMWRGIEVELDFPERDVVHVSTRIPPHYRGCRTIFVGTIGAMRTTTRRIGLPPCTTLSYDVGTHHGVYRMKTPPSRTVPARLSRRLGWEGWVSFSRGDVDELDRALAEVGGAQARLHAFTRQLEALADAGRDLARCEDVESFAERVVAIVVGLGFTGCRLWIRPSAGEAVVAREQGDLRGPPDRHPLERADRDLGALETWGRPTSPELLTMLLPWVVLGLDNLRALAAERARADAAQIERSRLLSQLVAAEASRDPAAVLDQRARDWKLTPAQTRVLGLVVDGLSNKQIAARLDVGEGTIEVHVTQVFRKSGAGNRAALVTRFWSG